jgi:pimeloyl-ACP methyl ester carboxylesterase
MSVLIWGALIVLSGFAAGAIYQALGSRRDRANHPAPGRLVDVGTHRLHLVASGKHEGPAIVCEAGLMSTVLSWTQIADQLSESFYVVRYDRAGLGWSDLGPMPRSADQIAEELHELLIRAGVAGPYLLVGHSFGGLTLPVFAARFPEQVRGLVLVDPVAASEWDPPTEHDRKLVSIGAKVCRRAAWLARLGVLRLVAWLLSTPAKTLAAGIVRLISRGAPQDSGAVSSPWFLALPLPEREMARVFWVEAKFALTIASQLENLPQSAESADYRTLVNKPVVILSAGNASSARRKAHAEMAAGLPQAVHLVSKGSGHWIMQDQPELVVEAIRQVDSKALRVRAQVYG